MRTVTAAAQRLHGDRAEVLERRAPHRYELVLNGEVVASQTTLAAMRDWIEDQPLVLVKAAGQR
ncbi:MAG: hypothetical protein ACJ790_08890 [Myxococcaceae bacterium]